MTTQEKIDAEEKRILDAFRKAKEMKFGELTAKVHRGSLTSLSITEKWTNQQGHLREPNGGGEQ